MHKSQCCTEQDGYQCENCNVKQGTWLESGAYLVYTCNSGYKLNNSGIAFCSRGEWLSIPACIGMKKYWKIILNNNKILNKYCIYYRNTLCKVTITFYVCYL